MPVVVGTDSYIDAAYLATFASARGVTISGDPDVLLIRAMDYLEGLESQWQGERTAADQPLAWPRYPVYLHGSLLASDAIPKQLKDAQAQLAIEADTRDLMPTVDASGKGAVTEETVDVITVKYAERKDASTQPVFMAAKRFYAPLMRQGGGSFAWVTRA